MEEILNHPWITGAQSGSISGSSPAPISSSLPNASDFHGRFKKPNPKHSSRSKKSAEAVQATTAAALAAQESGYPDPEYSKDPGFRNNGFNKDSDFDKFRQESGISCPADDIMIIEDITDRNRKPERCTDLSGSSGFSGSISGISGAIGFSVSSEAAGTFGSSSGLSGFPTGSSPSLSGSSDHRNSASLEMELL